MKGKHRGIAFYILGSLAFVLIAGFTAHYHYRSPWHISPAEPRPPMDPQLDYWEQAQRHTPVVFPELPRVFLHIAVHRFEDSLFIDREFVPGPRPRGHLGADRLLAEGAEVALPGGERVQLKAVGLKVPGEKRARFYDPHQMELLPDQSIEDWALDEATTSDAKSPQLQLFFEGDAAYRLENLQIFDARCQWRVGGGDIHGYQQGRLERSGLSYLSANLAIWHDTPLAIAVEVPCGNPIVTPLSLEADEQPIIEGAFRYQFAAAGAGEALLIGRHGEDWRINPEVPGVFAISRVAPSGWAPQFFLGLDGHPEVVPKPMDVRPMFQTVHLDADPALLKPGALTLSFYPERKRVWFDLAALPGMPNGSDENLFTVRFQPDMSLYPNLMELMEQAATTMELSLAVTTRVNTVFTSKGKVSELATPTEQSVKPVQEAIADEDGYVTPEAILKQWLAVNPAYRAKVDTANSVLMLSPRPPSWTDRAVQAWAQFWDRF